MRVNEIFYSLQGEGHWTGTAAVFLRLSGCNLKCPFCDTQHETFTEMAVDEIMDEVTRFPSRHIVITGGEPTLQITPELTDALHAAGFFIQIETNGTIPLREGVAIDWITCSPKNRDIRIQHIHEVKALYKGPESEPELDWIYNNLISNRIKHPSLLEGLGRLQPLDTGDENKNKVIIKATISYILNHTQWKLSLQTHKMLGLR